MTARDAQSLQVVRLHVNRTVRELVADPARQLDRGLDRAAHLVRFQRHDRDDVGGADPRMGALVAAQVDAVARAGDAREQRLDQLVRVADEREDRAVVVGVDVHVEQARGRRERTAQRLDHRVVAAFREVGHRLQHRP